MPMPQSLLVVNSTSNDRTFGSSVTYGEYITFHLAFSVPKGTTLAPKLVVTLPHITGLLVLDSASVLSMSPSIVPSGYEMDISDVDDDLFDDTITISYTSLVRATGSAANEDTIVYQIVAFVSMDTARNRVGQQLITTAQLTSFNGEETITEKLQSTTVTMVQPELTWSILWNTSTGDAGDIAECSVTIQHAPTSSASADDVDLFGMLAPYFILIPDSIASTNPTTIFSLFSLNRDWTGLARIPTLPLDGEPVVITFSSIINTTVRAGSVITSSLMTNYTSFYHGGLNTYHSNLFFFYNTILLYYF